MRAYRLFVALGDSILSDDFPGPGQGAAALLHRRLQGVPGHLLARTGYTVKDVLASMAGLKPHPGPVLVALTVGGNDLLQAGAPPASLGPGLEEIERRLSELYPDHDLLLGNLYDPTDGTGRVQSDEWRLGAPPRPHMLAALQEVNRVLAAGPGHLVDLNGLFRGRTKEWIMRDIEPNPDGARAIAGAFWEALG